MADIATNLFTPSFGLHDNKGSNVYFKEGESEASFLGTLSAMPGESTEEKRITMLSNIYGTTFSRGYDSIFAKMPTTIVVYDDKACYAAQSLKLNDFHTNHIHHTTLIERLTKA